MLGDTGLEISRICLGCMRFGTGKYGWGLDRAESERILGETLDGHDRDRFVVGTKVYTQMDEDDPNSGELSRKAIEQELDSSLDRLGTETVDLYTIHRWDYQTPIEVTLRTLDDAVRRSEGRYPGASSMWTSQFADALHARCFRSALRRESASRRGARWRGC